MESQRAKKKISDDVTTCKGNSEEIPLDLFPDILKASPVKTLAKFLCVSKQFAPIIRNRDFMKSYLLKTFPRPQSLMFTFYGNVSGKHFFFLSPQPQDPVESSPSSPSATATYLMNCRAFPYSTVSPSVHGLIFYGPPAKPMVYNPSTRRSITLPKIDTKDICTYRYLGYDPIDGDYKVLWMTRGMHVMWGFYQAEEPRILTLGNGNSWRVVEDFPPHLVCRDDGPDICINGVLYYVAFLHTTQSHVVVTFDVRSENFGFIEGPYRGCMLPKMTRYEGKPALLYSGMGDMRINLWILEDAARHEWSKKWYDASPIVKDDDYFHFRPFCANDAGEIVLAPSNVCTRPFYVLYFHPEKNYMRRAYIEGISRPNIPLWNKDTCHQIISVFSGQVDNLMFL